MAKDSKGHGSEGANDNSARRPTGYRVVRAGTNKAMGRDFGPNSKGMAVRHAKRMDYEHSVMGATAKHEVVPLHGSRTPPQKHPKINMAEVLAKHAKRPRNT